MKGDEAVPFEVLRYQIEKYRINCTTVYKERKTMECLNRLGKYPPQGGPMKRITSDLRAETAVIAQSV
jgi:hypothetical protein